MFATAWPVSAQPFTDQFIAILSGEEEVPPVETQARGFARFRFSDEESPVLRYRLILVNIEEVTQAHIHLAPRGENGPIVAFLLNFGALPLSVIGLLERMIMEEDLIGSLEGMTLEELIAEMEAGNTHVNVPTLTDPGGEIRGEIRAAGFGSWLLTFFRKDISVFSSSSRLRIQSKQNTCIL